MAVLYIAALLVVMLACGNCQKSISIENKTYVNIMTMSGKMMASKQMNISEDKNKLMFEFKWLKQLREDGTVEGNPVTDVNLNLTGPNDIPASANVLASKQVVGIASVLDSAILTVTYDVYTAGGNLTRGTEVTTVMEGDVKVSLKLSSYTGENVTMLELKFEVEGSKDATVESDMSTDGVGYNLGGEGVAKLSKKEMVGMAYVDVMLMMMDNMFTVKFNKTAETVYEYSFVLKLAAVDTSPDTPDPSSSTRVTSLGALVFFLVTSHRLLW